MLVFAITLIQNWASMRATGLRFRARLDIRPAAPFHFDGTVYKPSHFPAPLDAWEPNRYWQALRFVIVDVRIGKSRDARDAAAHLDMRKKVSRLGVPVFFFLGRHDHHVDANLANEYFETLSAPRKEMFWFEQSAHDIPFYEPDLFDRRVVDIARSLND